MADMLAEPDELRTFIGRDDLDDAHATLALTLATGLVQNACRQRLVAVADDVAVLTPERRPYLLLPERPVTAVTTVEATNYGDTAWQELDATRWQLVNGNGALMYDVGLDWDFPNVRVTYDHGFAVIPEDLRAVVLGIAMRTVTNPNGVRSEQIGSYSYTLATGSTDGLTVYERDVCNRYRQRTYAMRGC